MEKWKVEDDVQVEGIQGRFLVVSDIEGDDAVCIIAKSSEATVQDMQRAKQIVALPELIEALNTIVEKLDEDEMNVESKEFEMWSIANEALRSL